MSKVPPVLASHQNYFLGLRKGVEVLGKQVEHHSLLVQRGQMEVESVRVWTRGAGQKLEEIGLAQRKLGGQVDAFERKVDALFQHEKAQLNQICEGVDSALQQVGCSLQNVQSKIGRLEKEQPIAPPGPSSSSTLPITQPQQPQVQVPKRSPLEKKPKLRLEPEPLTQGELLETGLSG